MGQTPIEQVIIPLKSRDELPPVLAGLQWIFITPEVNGEIFELLEERVSPSKVPTGRPGMDLWHILVLGVVRLGLDCDYDRLEHVGNYDVLVRAILGEPSVDEGGRSYHQKTLSQNVCHIDEELLARINEIVVRHGRKEFKKNAGEKIAAKTDSYVLETNVHFPTDLNLLWDAGRKCIELLSDLSPRGWRKAKHWKKALKGRMRRASKVSQGGGAHKEERTRVAVKNYLSKARELEIKVAEDLRQLRASAADMRVQMRLDQVEYFQEMLVKHIDLVDRRLLHGETIPHEEKLFSLFEPHTEWLTKGKSRPAVELGHPLLLSTDQYQLVIDYRVMEKSTDVAETMPLAQRLFDRFGEDAFSSMSFDKGFSRVKDREALEAKVPVVVMPRKGRLGEADRERERTRKFVRLKNRHSAVESNINSLEHHGLNRCPDKGLRGFKRYVGLGVLAYNLHRIGNRILQKQREAAEAASGLPRAA
jgi:hypothetical protein